MNIVTNLTLKIPFVTFHTSEFKNARVKYWLCMMHRLKLMACRTANRQCICWCVTIKRRAIIILRKERTRTRRVFFLLPISQVLIYSTKIQASAYTYLYIYVYIHVYGLVVYTVYIHVCICQVYMYTIYVYCIPYKILFKNIICNRKIFTGLAPYRALILQDGLQRNISNLFQDKPYIKLILICYRSLLI